MAEEAVKFSEEGDNVILCHPGPAADSSVYAEFRAHCSISSDNEFSDDSPLLFKITVDSKESAKKQQTRNQYQYPSKLEKCCPEKRK